MLCRPNLRTQALGGFVRLSQSQPRFSQQQLRQAHDARTHRRASPKVIFSGIQPTGVPHLGNYLGALKNWVKLQNEAAPDTKLLYSIVDLHALTMPQEAKKLRQHKRETLAMLLAVGLDPERSIIFYQSSVAAHSELMWILSCTASTGHLSRMTQWKSKLGMTDTTTVSSDKAQINLKLGLFSYPVLQAADIMVHRATHVPVGEDQQQHLEFARACAGAFNAAYGPHLVAPQTILSPARRIMSLTVPDQKMSKSDPNPKSRIFLTDEPDDIRRKILTAMTDSNARVVTYEPETRRGVANLLEMLALLEPGTTPEQLAEEFVAVEDPTTGKMSVPFKQMKQRLAEAIVVELAGIRERYLDYLTRDRGKWLDSVADMGATKARANAERTMRTVRDVVGL